MRSVFPLILVVAAAVSACTDSEDRLVSAGQTITIPQAEAFCHDHPGDSVCSH